MEANHKNRTRRSANRSSVYAILSETDQALRHKDILNILQGSCDRVTVYRALDRLMSEKKIIRFLAPNGNTYFGLSSKGLPADWVYVYCICRRCNKIKRIKATIPAVSFSASFQPDNSIHLIEGNCCCITNF